LKCPRCGSTKFRLLSQLRDTAEIDNEAKTVTIHVDETAYFVPEAFYDSVKCAECGAEINCDRFFEAVRNYKLEVR